MHRPFDLLDRILPLGPSPPSSSSSSSSPPSFSAPIYILFTMSIRLQPSIRPPSINLLCDIGTRHVERNDASRK